MKKSNNKNRNEKTPFFLQIESYNYKANESFFSKKTHNAFRVDSLFKLKSK
ncbi:MAG: hypothetical protein Q8920_11470 [Bacillota bacterium]|nr:hypothetical protein [Bacillota bacterium]